LLKLVLVDLSLLLLEHILNSTQSSTNKERPQQQQSKHKANRIGLRLLIQ